MNNSSEDISIINIPVISKDSDYLVTPPKGYATPFLDLKDEKKFKIKTSDGKFIEFTSSSDTPDYSNLTATNKHLLEGYIAIGKDGEEITGEIPIYTTTGIGGNSIISFNTDTSNDYYVHVKSGYNSSDFRYYIGTNYDNFIDHYDGNGSVTLNQAGVCFGMKNYPAYFPNGITITWDENIKPENIKKGITIYGVKGSHECPESTGLTLPEGYDKYKQVTDSDVAEGSVCLIVNSNKQLEMIKGSLQSFITILGADQGDKYYNYPIYQKTTFISGPGALFDDEILRIDCDPEGYIIPENIKKGVTILGVEGTYEGTSIQESTFKLVKIIETGKFPESIVLTEDGSSVEGHDYYGTYIIEDNSKSGTYRVYKHTYIDPDTSNITYYWLKVITFKLTDGNTYICWAVVTNPELSVLAVGDELNEEVSVYSNSIYNIPDSNNIRLPEGKLDWYTSTPIPPREGGNKLVGVHVAYSTNSYHCSTINEYKNGFYIDNGDDIIMTPENKENTYEVGSIVLSYNNKLIGNPIQK